MPSPLLSHLPPLAALLVVLMTGCATPTPRHSVELSDLTLEATPWTPGFGPGDVLRVTVLGHPELSTHPDGTRVSAAGLLHLPVLGGLPIEGQSSSELEVAIADGIGRYLRDPNVTVEPLEVVSRAYHVIGHVTEPGRKSLERPLNALEALAAGGPLSRGADREQVWLLRLQDEELAAHTFSMKRPGLDGLVQVQPGDILFVAQTGYDDFQEDLLPALAGIGIPLGILLGSAAD